MQDKVERVEIHGGTCMAARLGRPVRMTSRKPTDGCSFSYKPEKSALYGPNGEKSVEIVAGRVDRETRSLVTINNPR
ncbi:hypothetical protein D3C78_1951220 [compost metagenome]